MEKWFKVDDLELDAIEIPQGVERIEYEVTGVRFQIDLNKGNREKLYTLLLPFMKASRRVGGGRVPDELAEVLGDDMPVSISAKAAASLRPAAAPVVRQEGRPLSMRRHTKVELRSVREFATSEHIQVSDGRIPSSVWQRWEDAGGLEWHLREAS